MKKLKSKKFLALLLTILLMILNIPFSVIASEANSEEMLSETSNIDSIPISDTEEYYIINATYKRVLRQYTNYSVNIGLFSNIPDACWRFDYIGNNKYCIRSASNPDYALYGIGETVEMDIMTGTPGMYYSWTIEPAANGGFIIKNCGGENVLCCARTALSLVAPRTSDDPNYSQTVWEFVESDKYVLITNHYYDEGFEVRFAFIDSNAKNLIKEYQDAVAERLLSIFNLQVLATYKSYTSIADTCKIDDYDAVTTLTCEAPCTHDANQSHTNRYDLMYTVLRGSSTSVSSLWTGHRLTNDARSASYDTTHKIIISSWLTRTFIPPNEYEERIAEENTFDLIHELSHQIGAPDHYCYGKGSTGKCINSDCDTCFNNMELRDCIMSSREDDMYCEDCINSINQHLADHH